MQIFAPKMSSMVFQVVVKMEEVLNPACGKSSIPSGPPNLDVENHWAAVRPVTASFFFSPSLLPKKPQQGNYDNEEKN